MKIELEKQLIEKYPQLFKDVNSTPQESCMCFGCECGDGWYDILDELCRKITEVDKEAYLLQVKEKYGALRVYGTFNEKAQKLAYEAEKESESVCEYCSKPGKIREGGWLRCLCDECEENK
jgi:hypothetical protein